MGLRERLGLSAEPPRVVSPFPVALERETWCGKPPVGPSEDLNRILALPRRDLATAYTDVDFGELAVSLMLKPGEKNWAGQNGCVCGSFNPPRPCPTHLKDDQARALLEAEKHGALLAAMGVGKGKTLVDLLLPFVMGSKVAVLLVPSALVDKIVNVDWRYYGGHWRLPNLVTHDGGSGGNWFNIGRPVLHVISYEKLSRQEGTTLLMNIKPDLVILDEAHKVKNPKGTRKIRIQRCLDAITPRPRVVPLSGTLASRGICDAAHLADWALGEGSPFPRKHGVVEEWGLALDPIVNDDEPAAGPGALERLEQVPGFDELVAADEVKLERKHKGNERARLAFRLRRNQTPGVVATTSSSFEGSLLIRKRMPGPMPAALLPLIERAKKGTRPDGEQAEEVVVGHGWARQIALGFFHRWRFPRGEPEELIKRWRVARCEWHREIRKKLEHPREHMDTPGLLKNAARRAQEGYEGDLPIWHAETWRDWAEVEPLVHPVPSTVWLDKGCPELAAIPGSDFVVKDALAWLEAEGPGIVWCEFPELGERIAKAAGLPWYGGGKRASAEIQAEKGDRSIVASMHAHRDGKDLQFAFSRNYFTSPYADGGHWEQGIGRTHRQGQSADEVTVDIAMHHEDFVSSFAKARERARFMDQTDGQEQKLLIASYDWA